MNHIKVDLQNSIKSYTEKKCVIRSGLALLLLCEFGSVESSQLEESNKQIAYKKYCGEQKKNDQEISKIPGARILHIFKTTLRNPKALTAGGLFVGVVGLCATIINQRAAMIQAKKIAEDQRSWTTICKTALANIPVFVPGLSAPIPAGAIIYSVIKYRDSIQEINEQGFSDSVKKNPKKFKDIK